MYSSRGRLETYAQWLVSAFFGNAFFIFLIRQFMLPFPRDLKDPALWERAHELQIRRHIAAPWPAITTVAIFDFMVGWPVYIDPLVFRRHPDKLALSADPRLWITRLCEEKRPQMAAAALSGCR